MTHAIELFFDPISDARIRRLWDGLTRSGVTVELTGRPHLTLSIFEGTDSSSVEETLTVLGSDMPHLAITFESIGIFPGERPLIFLNPVVNATLLAFHRRVHAGLTKSGAGSVSEHYNPGYWTPHCTLGRLKNQDALIRALPSLNSIRLPFTVHAVVLGAVGES